MSIANQIQRIKTNITNAYNEIEKFNVNVSEYNNKSAKLAEAISNITVGETINNQNKTITENGTYTADEGYTGLGEVVVDVAGGSQEIPSGFTQYDYLAKISGTGYLDLQFIATHNTKIELDFRITGYNGTNANGFFGYNSAGSDGFYISVASESAENARSWNCKFDGGSISNVVNTLNTRYKLVMSKDGVLVNDELIGTYDSISDFSTGGSCYLFKIDGYDRDMYSQVYGLKVWENDEIIHDYIPALKINSSSLGLYDSLTGYFYAVSSATGFSLGNIQLLTINPIPQNATVKLTADGYIQEDSGNCIYVAEGTEVTYSVSADGYITQTGTVTVNDTQTIDIILDEGGGLGGGIWG